MDGCYLFHHFTYRLEYSYHLQPQLPQASPKIQAVTALMPLAPTPTFAHRESVHTQACTQAAQRQTTRFNAEDDLRRRQTKPPPPRCRQSFPPPPPPSGTPLRTIWSPRRSVETSRKTATWKLWIYGNERAVRRQQLDIWHFFARRSVGRWKL